MYYFWLLAAVVLVFIDRLTKWLVVSNMDLKDTIHLIKFGDTQVLNLYYCLNDGAAFSGFSGRRILLIVFTSAVILWLLYMLLFKKVNSRLRTLAVVLLISGGIGNLIDRIFNDGLVVDFIDFRLINFPIFNFADICAVCGAGIIILSVIIDEIHEHKKKSAESAEELAGKENDGKN
ncbi:MAG: signal peptidase II [Oscillospiraceae bacterium]